MSRTSTASTALPRAKQLRLVIPVRRVAMARVAEVVLPVVEDVAAVRVAVGVADLGAAVAEALAAVVAGVGSRVWFCTRGRRDLRRPLFLPVGEHCCSLGAELRSGEQECSPHTGVL